ncbi:hypothetical protein LDL77_06395 [Flagellimonas marinaquae]|uniref:hypothetical protein n=1 Tax=Flagellimonas aurea TaxID=2915619 RepID=UPI001CE0F537|nr:hypothetical protein LDL77_06395 [Allomuricauda aquimarina]
MSDLVKSILIQFGITTTLLGALIFILKKVFINLVKLKIDEAFEKKKLELEITKERQIDRLRRTTQLYPKVLENTYRLRNEIRSITDKIKLERIVTKDRVYSKDSFQSVDISYMVSQRNTLEELLYTSKVFLTPTTYQALHDFKHHGYYLEQRINDLKMHVAKGIDEPKIINPIIEEIENTFIMTDNLFLTVDRDVTTKMNP